MVMVNLLLCFVVLLFFFFFKQKTAYEMRISEWSSDVCSSDLQGFLLSAPALPPLQQEYENALRQAERPGTGIHPGTDAPASISVRNLDVAYDEIGRASCRERVCQYV